MQGHSDPNRELLDARALCRQLVRDGSVEAFLADHRHELFPDQMFEDLFPSGRGRPSVPADVVASVMVLQALEGLGPGRRPCAKRPDQLESGLRTGLGRRGLRLLGARILAGQAQELRAAGKDFEAVRAVVDATGVLRGKARRALDSTLLDDAVATQDTVTQLIAAVRRARRVVPGATC